MVPVVTALAVSYCIFCFLEVSEPSHSIYPQRYSPCCLMDPKGIFMELQVSDTQQHVIKSVPKTLWEWVVKLAQFTKSARFIYLLGLASFRIFDCIIFLQLFYLSPKNLFVYPCFLLWALVLIYCHGLFLNYIYSEKDTLKNEYSHLRNERKKGNVVGYPSGIQEQMRGKKNPKF